MNMRVAQAAGWLLFWLLFMALWFAWPAHAQRTATIAVCGTLTQATPAIGSAGIIALDTSGNVCIAGTLSTTIAGFAPAGTFATLTATGSSASVALPAGTVVIFQNTGTTAVSCTLGVGSATAVVSQNIIQPGSWASYTVGSNTFGACIDQTGSASNVVVLSGGSGIPTGAGGGSSSGGGGAVTIADGADVALGTTTDAACATDNGTCTTLQLIKRSNQRLTTLITNLGVANTNGQATMASSAPVVIASNQTAVPASVASGGVASGAVASGAYASGSISSGAVASGAFASGSISSGAFAAGSFLNATAADACMFQAKINQVINQTTGTQIIAGTSAKKTYVCSLMLIAQAAEIFNVIAGTGSVCATGTSVVVGSSTASQGLSLAANGGVTFGNGGGTVFAATAAAADNVCITQNGSNRISGVVTYVQQ